MGEFRDSLISPSVPMLYKQCVAVSEWNNGKGLPHRNHRRSGGSKPPFVGNGHCYSEMESSRQSQSSLRRVTKCCAPGRSVGRRLQALACLLVAGIIAGGWSYFQRQRSEARRVAEETLASIADLKAGQIAGWMKERRADAETSFNKPQARQFLTEPDNAAVREELLQWMTTVQRIYDYSAVALFDARATVRLAVPADEPLPHPYVQDALRAREVIVTDLHRDQPNQPIHLSLLIPVGVKPQAGQPADGVLLFVIEPHRFLYPLVQSWPTPSRTAETLLVHREGDEVVYLNELRHRTNTALALRLPMNRPNYPAAMAVQGREGVFEGTDYRDMPVLAATRKIPGTPWFMEAKVDQEEIYAPLRQEAWTVGLMTALLLLAALLGIGLLWRQQKLESSRRELADRARAEAVLRESEQRLRRAQKVAHLGDWELDSVHNRLSWSDEVYRIFGLKPQEFGATYEAFLERVHPDDRQKLDDAYGSSLRENRDTYEIEHRVIRKDTGEVRVVHEQCVHFRDATGKIIRSIGTVHDITERKQAEEALRREQLFNTTLLDNLAEGVVACDASGTLALFNKAARDWHGMDAMALPAEEWAQHYDLYAFDGVTPLPTASIPLVRAFAGEAVRNTGMAIVAKGQPPRFIMASGDSVFDPQGRKLGAVVVMFDITERKQAEASLRESEAKHRLLFETSHDAIMTLAPPSWKFTSGNPVAVRMFGARDEADFISRGPWDYSPERQPDGRLSADKAREMIETAMRDGSHFFEWTHKRLGGEEFPATVLLSRFELGGQTLLQANVRDITERKRAEQVLRQHAEELRLRNEDLERFNRLSVGRELQMIELKKEINELCRRAGEAPRYKTEFNEPKEIKRRDPCSTT